MIYFWVFIIFVVVAAVVMSFSEAKEAKKRENIILNLPDFTITDKYISGSSGVSVAFDSKRKKVCFIDKELKVSIYDFGDILASEIEEDGETIIKKSVSGTLGRALVGGILTGGIGALVGGLTATGKQKEKIKSINLKITVNDLSNPIYKLNFLNIEAKRGSLVYKSAYEQVEKWHGIFSVLVNQKS